MTIATTVEPRSGAGSSTYNMVALTGVYEISKILTTPQPLGSLLANVIGVLSSFMQMRRGMILLLDENGDPEMAASAGIAAANAMKNGTLVPQRAIDQIVATGMPFVVENIAKHPYFTGSAYLYTAPPKTTVSFIGVPVKMGGAVRGTLSIDREWNGSLQFRLEDDVRFLSMIANLIGQTLQLHQTVNNDRERLIAEQQHLEKELAETQKGGSARASADANAADRKASKRSAPPAGIIGDSPVMRALLDKIGTAARSNAPILLRGETGTGKEMFARAIHEQSERRNQPFVKVNCAALPESVIESELFGHEKGSFTGAVAQRKGRFELADKGTLFLDEIGEISPAFQAKLLRVLQEGEFERVGGTQTIKVNIRLICATNRHLEDAVMKGQFRADLYYRINVVGLILPPLRERVEDIPALAHNFLERFGQENGRHFHFTPEVLDVLSHCNFPGNVRELENCVRRTAALSGDAELRSEHLACKQGTCLSATLWKGRGPNSLVNLMPAVPQAAPAATGAPAPHPGAFAPQPFPPQPHFPQPQAPQPYTSQPHTSQPYTSQPYTSQPSAAQPAAPAVPAAAPAPPLVPAVAEPVAAEADAEVEDYAPMGGDTLDLPIAHHAGGACPAPNACPVTQSALKDRERLIQAMEKSGWVQAKAARLLGITPRQIGYALRKQGIDIQRL